MKLTDSLKTATLGLRHAKVRSVLTMLGIVIGIASVTLLMSVGRSAQEVIIGQVQDIGSNIIFIFPGATKGSRFSSPPSVQGVVIKTLLKGDVDAMKRELSVERVAPQAHGQARIVYENNDTLVTYIGTTGDFFPIRNFNAAQGVVFTNADNQSFTHTIVLGAVIAETLFENTDPIGKTVRLKNATFTVRGVLEKKGLGPMGVDNDTLVFIPLDVALKQLLGIDYYSVVTVQGKDDYAIEFVKERVTAVLRQNHKITDPDKDDFTIRTQEDALELLGSITSILTIFLTSIASISLIVGGIGIMNIMLVSVVERTREIGLRKAIGATNGDIMQQFLWEAIILTVLGGVVGIAVGFFFTVVLYIAVVNFAGIDWVFSFPPSAVGLAVFVSTVVGIAFGIYPARKAAMKNPIDALRYE